MGVLFPIQLAHVDLKCMKLIETCHHLFWSLAYSIVFSCVRFHSKNVAEVPCNRLQFWGKCEDCREQKNILCLGLRWVSSGWDRQNGHILSQTWSFLAECGDHLSGGALADPNLKTTDGVETRGVNGTKIVWTKEWFIIHYEIHRNSLFHLICIWWPPQRSPEDHWQFAEFAGCLDWWLEPRRL